MEKAPTEEEIESERERAAPKRELSQKQKSKILQIIRQSSIKAIELKENYCVLLCIYFRKQPQTFFLF